MLKGISVVYDLPAIRGAGGSRRGGPREPIPASHQDRGEDGAAGPQKDVIAPTRGDTLHTLAEMLHEHFAEEVRRRDRDGNGRLNRAEFGGSSEEFAAIDTDRDGYLRTGDLVRAALARNPILQEMVSGPWAELHNALIRAGTTDKEQLELIISDKCRDLNLDAEQFFQQNPDISALHSTLTGLADRLGRFRRYHPVDLTA